MTAGWLKEARSQRNEGLNSWFPLTACLEPSVDVWLEDGEDGQISLNIRMAPALFMDQNTSLTTVVVYWTINTIVKFITVSAFIYFTDINMTVGDFRMLIAQHLTVLIL